MSEREFEDERADARQRDDASVVAHEEEPRLGKEDRETGAVRARTRVEKRRVAEVVPRSTEHFDEVERTVGNEEDSGEIETLPDGSISIPVFEEELVVTKRTVVRERIVVRKRRETEHRRVEAELRREHVDVDVDPDVEDRVETGE